MPSSTDIALTLQIARKQEIATDIVAFELVHPDREVLPHFTPGAHIGVRTPCGIERDFSLCNADEDDTYYEIAVQRESGGRGSASLIDEAAVGGTLEVTLPRNDFPLLPSAAGYVFIAGGIGITPILSMVRSLTRSSGASFKLYYCTRSPDQTAFRDELGSARFRGRVTIHHDAGDPQRRFDFWPVLESPGGRQLYCCGPQTLMREVQDMTGHWPSSAVHFEAFTKTARSRPDDRPFTVRLAGSGDVIEIPADATILETLRSKGYELRSSCESGTCGTCRTRYLAGEPEHRDFVLHAADRETSIMICVSRARSEELVLDL